MDLDQAMHLERDGDGHRIRYAIADVPTFVRLGGALDRVTRERGQTVYCPDVRVPLHPEVLSEAAASLLPDAVRPAFVWDLRLDGAGLLTSAQVYRAMVRSVERLDYAQVQAAVDAGTDDERFLLLKEIGERRIAQERARGGASLPMPEQQVTARDGGGFTLEFRPLGRGRGVERAGLAAHRHGRRPDDAGCRRGRAAHHAGPDARGGGVVPEGGPRPGRRVAGGRALRRVRPRPGPLQPAPPGPHPRGDGPVPRRRATPRSTGEPPPQPEHAAVAAPYAHVTAPLRRLVDRFGLVVCEAACRGAEVPDAVRAALPQLAELMRDSDRRARAAERACADATEAAVLHGREGESFGAIVIDHTDKGMEVQLVDLPVIARVTGRRCRAGRQPVGAARPRRRAAPARWPSATSDADPYTGGGRVGRTVASVGNHRRGRSGLRRAGWWPTATRGDPRDSATENRPPRRASGRSKGETVV